MISYLEGTVKFKGISSITLLTGGVGYRVAVPLYIINSIVLDSFCTLFIYSHIREDCFDLYGFYNQEDLGLFELLIGVSGIGPKTALGIFNNGKSEKIKEAIVKGDTEFFAGVPRLGKKNAQKIIIELRSKLGELGEFDLNGDGVGEMKEVRDALVSLGFGGPEAKEALKFVREIEGDVGVKVREAIRFLGKK